MDKVYQNKGEEKEERVVCIKFNRRIREEKGEMKKRREEKRKEKKNEEKVKKEESGGVRQRQKNDKERERNTLLRGWIFLKLEKQSFLNFFKRR